MAYRLVVETGVVCHTAPDRASATTESLPLATRLGVTRERQVDSTLWYFDQWHVSGVFPSCWVYGPSTAEWDSSNPVPSFLTMLERMTAHSDVTFEEYVRVDNLLRDTIGVPEDLRAKLAASGLLQFRRLQLLERALSGNGGDGEVIDAVPLKKAWMLAHDDLVLLDPFGGRWYVRAEPYWTVYEGNKRAPWADDLAWIAAQHVRATDECMSDCALHLKIIEGPLQYWTRLPTGEHIADAIRDAAEMAKYAAGMACYDKDQVPPGRESNSPVPPALVEQIRNSLTDVLFAGKDDILKSLDEAERHCAK